ncbi:MAG: asparagine synthase (glutamine-hydrolyzing) [Bacteroidetes bacterium]|nr:MAG: asparagine synthase (glutamine-hydrolyzing) [Bacteroidota bacterium]TAG87771.1 MAG: asparagine synthase (glutamine-hydrolyzing) [Bacteroidota bacterium]
MCGIAGYLSFSQKFQESHLQLMTDTIKHRGPDADGFFADGIVGLGHRRLSILDLSAKANQPMISNDERWVIVFNGEIYNYRELLRQIEVPLKTTGDTEVILELFAKQYLKCVYYFNGMFAFAIYDRVEQDLFVFRDRIGIKPVYYYWDGENFAFSSELKSLTKLPIDLEYNKQALADFLHLGYIPTPHTPYKNIFKMQAGSWLKVNKSGLVAEKYWELTDKLHTRETKEKLHLYNREKEAKAYLKNLLESSLNYRLISDVPVGILLSGGIDSSVVAAFASKQSNARVDSFTIGFKDSKSNESEFAKSVAQHLGTNHHELMVSIDDAKELIPKILDIYDEPFGDTSAVPTSIVSQLARKHVKVALGGDGGDELFFGYGMYRWAERLNNGFWGTFRKPTAQLLKISKKPSFQKAKNLFNYPKKEELASHIFSQEQFYFSKKEIGQLLIESPLTTLLRYPEAPRNLSPAEKQALFDLYYYLPDDLLTKVDRASMMHALEVRVPLLDHRIIEFAINLNPALKVQGKTTKYLLKQILYDFVPEKMFQRPKQGFSIPMIQWLQTDLKYLIDTHLSKENIEKIGIVKYEMVENIKKKFFKGQTFFYNRLWALIVLHQFLGK